MARYLLKASNGVVRGPLSGSDLRREAKLGLVLATDEICVEGTSRWVPAVRVRGLADLIASVPPLPVDAPELPIESTLGAMPSAPSSDPATELPQEWSPGHAGTKPPIKPETGLHDDRVTAHGGPRPGGDTANQYGILRFVAETVSHVGWGLLTISFMAAVFFFVLWI